MAELAFSILCVGSLIGLIVLLVLAVWQSVQRGNRDGYRALQARCGELETLLYGIKEQRNQLARRVVELEGYLTPSQQARMDWQTIMDLNDENQALKERLNGARLLVLALAAQAGVTIDQDSAGGWRVV